MRRWGAGLVLLALLAGWVCLLATLGWMHWLRSLGETPDFVLHPYPRARSCRSCHLQVYDDWLLSPHAKALASLAPRQMSAGEKVENCMPCHAPQPVLLHDLSKPPLTRLDYQADGVSCQTCHQLESGVAAAKKPAPGACQPRQDARMLSVELCQACHNAHGTVDQWRQSRFAKAGQDCRSCHVHNHQMLGAHDSRSLRQAVRLDLHTTTGRLQVTVTNQGAGHNIPSGRRSREMILVTRWSTASGKSGQQRFRFRNPFKGEPGENTQLPAGQSRTFEVAVPPEVGRVDVRLIYQFRPSQPDASGVLLQQIVRDF